MDQGETWHAGSPRSWPHCVRWEPSSPPLKGHRTAQPQFSAHICCAQMAGRIKMPLGRELGLGPSDIVLDRDPAPLPKKGAEVPNLPPMSIVAKQLDSSGCHLVRRWASAQVTLCLMGTQLSLPYRGTAPNFQPMSVVAKWLDGVRCHLVLW